MTPRLYARVVLISFCLIILVGSSIPGDQIPKGFQLTPDKLIHCVEYFMLGVFIYRWLLAEFTSKPPSLLLVITVLMGSVFGALDENYQRLTPGRTPDFWDWVLDTIGVLVAAIVSYAIWSKKSPDKSRLSTFTVLEIN